MEKRFNFNPLTFKLEEIVESDKGENLELKSGLYQILIKQAFLKESNHSEAYAISFLFDVLNDKDGHAFRVENQRIDIWFIKSDGTPIDFASKKIASLLYLCGLPTQINSDCFVDDKVMVMKYNKDINAYEEVFEEKPNFKALVGKRVWALIGLKYEEYNNKPVKRYDFNSFYNDSFKSISEIKSNKEAKNWSNRLEYCLKVEQDTFNNVKYLHSNNEVSTKEESNIPPYAINYSSPSHNEFNIADEEIPF